MSYALRLCITILSAGGLLAAGLAISGFYRRRSAGRFLLGCFPAAVVSIVVAVYMMIALPFKDYAAHFPVPSCFPGEHRLSTQASLAGPTGLAVGPNGDIILVESANNCIRRIDAVTHRIETVYGRPGLHFYPDRLHVVDCSGTVRFDIRRDLLIVEPVACRVSKMSLDTKRVSVLAGTGEQGFSGDGGPATGALLTCPMDVATDRRGNLYVADAGNHRVRRIDALTGIITTVAGSGREGYAGDRGLAVDAALGSPAGLAVNRAGDLFIADEEYHVVRKVDKATGTIETIVGDGWADRDATPAINRPGWRLDVGVGRLAGDGGLAVKASLDGPRSILLDGMGGLLICDSGNYCIRKVDLRTGIISTIAGPGTSDRLGDGGPAREASLRGPVDIAVDRAANLFIADLMADRIRRVNGSGVISTVAGDGRNGVIERPMMMGIPLD